MQRIKEYFNKHPKLKKITKILAVVGIVLSFAFNAIIIGTVIIQQQKENNINEPLVYGDYTPNTKGAIKLPAGNGALYSTGDFEWQIFYESILSYYGEICSIYDPQEFYADYNFEASVNVFEVRFQPSYTYLDISQWTTCKVKQFIIYKHPALNNEKHVTYNMDFRFDWNNVDTTFRMNYEVSYGLNFIGTAMDGNTAVNRNLYLQNQGNTVNYWAYNAYILSTNVGVFHNLFYKNVTDFSSSYDIGLKDGYTDGYFSGRESGYQDGRSAGYNEGLNVGYQQGIQIGPHYDPFQAIKGAFDAVSSIFDINILPGLSIGLLVFTPIVIAVIIVVVKMIKT